MSHQQVVQAAVAAAAAQGVEATVIVIGGNGAAPQDGFVQVEHEHYHHSASESEVTEALGAAERRVQELTAQLALRDGTISDLQTKVEAAEERIAIMADGAAPAPAAGEQPTDLVSIDTYSIDVLGIPEEHAKKLKKVYATVGELRTAAAEGKLKDIKLKGGQKTIIAIQEKLLGQAPSATIPAGAGAPATTPASSDVPAGHEDRLWLDRLGAVKAKERDMLEQAARLEQIRQQYPADSDMPDEDYDKYLDIRHQHDIAKAQVVALVWGLGLDKDHLRDGNVDACLQAAGLSHLMESPQPRVVPAEA